ncbi:UrcA family protein [Brevundimonas sp.]|uniref:UrcA family protein n=1 Tax=Brevundimonas sp. TaxID=1871086 RepID=UPI002D34DE7D|nr:UrcA family protein [Brevundimonas sp.]HYC96565.1 UrcA family protein [Brevundimonas sp.]
MRPLAIVCGLLLAACSALSAHAEEPAPQARFSYGDLNLRDPADRRTLVARVDQATADYCRDHSAVVTPYHRRGDRAYCRASIRAQLTWAMPPRVRSAYQTAWARRPVG